MCNTYRRVTANAELSPEQERAVRDFIERWNRTVEPLAESLESAIRRGVLDLGTTDAIRTDIKAEFGNFTNDLDVIFREHAKDAAQAGRAIAARQHQLDISFDIVPRRTIDELEDWATTASGHVSDTLEDNVTAWLKGAHEEGLSVDDIADQFQDEFVDGRLKDWKAEQLARDNTVAPSNAGNHSALEDAPGVVGEQWLDAGDGRVRETHEEADGQVVGVDQPFLVGGYEAMHPGDPALPVEEFTQCRCTAVPVFANDLTADQEATLRAGGRFWM